MASHRQHSSSSSNPFPTPTSTSSSSLLMPTPYTNTSTVNSKVSQPNEPLYSTVIPRSMRPTPDPAYSINSQARPKSVADTSKDDSLLQLRVAHLESLVSRQNKEKKGMEEEFGRQRKKFMQAMTTTENEMKLLKQSVQKHIQQIENLNKALLEKEEDSKIMAKTINASLRETFDADRVKYEQEIAKLKLMLQESSHEHQVEIQKLKLQIPSQPLQGRGGEKHLKSDSHLLEVSLPSNSNSRRSKSPSGRRSPSGHKSPSGRRSPEETTSALNFSSESSLESSMIEAAKDAKLLKSVIVPLEEEIDMLKMQLSEAQKRLQVYEGKEHSPILPLSVAMEMSRQEGGVSPQEVSDKEVLEKLLNQEREARHDLEMHIEGLRRQKSVLADNNEELKQDVTQIHKNLEKEQKRYLELEGTWKKANVQFIAVQDELRHEVHQLKEKLSLEEQKSKDKLESAGIYSPRPSSPIRPSTSRRIGGVRKRAVSWSEGDSTSYASNDEVSIWKAVTEQVQRLLSEQHHELQNKEAALTMYEKQLERTQGQLMSEIDEKDNEIFKMRKEVQKIQAALLRERKTRNELKRTLSTAKEDMKNEVKHFQTSEANIKQKHKLYKDKFTETRHDIQKQLASFTEDRTRLYSLVSQKEEEYDCLKALQTSEKMHYDERIQEIEQAKKEAELNVAFAMEELTKLRDKSVKLETELTTEVSDLRKLVDSAQHEKDSLEEQLLSSLSETSEIRKVNNQLEHDRHLAILSRTNLQEQSRDMMQDQLLQLNNLKREKEENMKTIYDLRQQLTQLREQLSNSESVQKDFVQLSQDLQVRLMEVETRQKEDEEINKSQEIL